MGVFARLQTTNANHRWKADGWRFTSAVYRGWDLKAQPAGAQVWVQSPYRHRNAPALS
jgi:hypothetical protein